MDRNDVDPGEVDDVLMGCVSQVGEQSGTPGRWAWLAAGLPEHVPAVTIDRRCGSGQQAIDYAAQAIMAGAYDIAVAGGVESMSRIPMISARIGQDPFGPSARARYDDKLVPQGVSAEIVAARFGLTRSALDSYAAQSHRRAAACADAGSFKSEIVPITVPTADGGTTAVDADESIRRGTTAEKLGELKAAFRTDELAADWPNLSWQVTAGNSSQITDGAAALLIMSEQRAKDLGLRPMARVHSFSLASADPIEMLTGPIPATEKILSRSGLSVADLDHVEVNEAFAPVPLAWIHRFDADPARVNPRGGAIALGHPLGASGARLMTTMVHALRASGGRYGLQTMCEGGGMANATIIERI
jgi:acetyl-CoA acetyltransferase family protein